MTKTASDRHGPARTLRSSAYGRERVELAVTRNGYRRVDWHGRRSWLGIDPETARQTYQRYCLHAFVVHVSRQVWQRVAGD